MYSTTMRVPGTKNWFMRDPVAKWSLEKQIRESHHQKKIMPIWSFRRCRLVSWGWLFRKGRQKGSSVSYLDEKKMKTQDFYTYTVMIFF